MKKLSIIILMWVAFLLPSHAVLKEANLDTTLFMLRTELTSYHLDFEKQNEYAKQQQQQIIKELMTIMAQADQNSIMLYSQRNGYIFDLTYACHEATEQFDKFKSKAAPFRGLINKNNIEVARFDSLINYLYNMNTMFMSKEAQLNRNVDLTLAVNIRRQLIERQQQLQDYKSLRHNREKTEVAQRLCQPTICRDTEQHLQQWWRQLSHYPAACKQPLQGSQDIGGREIQTCSGHDVAMGRKNHLHPLQHHHFLWHCFYCPQPFYHPHRGDTIGETRSF